MSRARSLAVFAAAAATIAGLAVPAGANPRDRMDVQATANPAGMVPARDAHGGPGGGGGGGSTVNMSGHGGPVLNTTQVPVAIFWGPKWGTSPGDKITGMDTWYSGFGGSNYAATSNEYSGSNGKVTSTVSFPSSNQNYIDTSPSAGGSNTATILGEVGKALSARGLTPQTNGYYPVYVDTPRGNANYCAWHSWGTLNGVMVQFAFFFWLDGDAGCDPQDSSGLHSQGLAAIANVSGHELSEARTDPQGTGWFDRQGAENGDKCAWTFGAPLLTLGNTKWKIQGEWSNAAYNNQTGYANRSGQKGCIGFS
jgi:hypothetical protein